MTGMTVTTPALRCRSIDLSFHSQTVLDSFSMTVAPGRIHALLGRNGAGKSTLFKIVLGLLEPDAGEVELFGAPWARAALREVGASVNGPALYGHLSARDNLRVHATLLGLSDAEVTRVLRLVGLADAGRKRAGTFSTGMKGRLSLAVAMLGRPRLLVLDEPQNGLDPRGIADLRVFLRDWAAQGGTVLISSHQLGEISRIADDVTVLAGGRERYSGPLGELAEPDRLEAEFLRLTDPLETARELYR